MARKDSNQIPLFDLPIEPAIRPLERIKDNDGSLPERFARFHDKNPHVYELIKKIALDLKNRGHKKFGIAFIFERIRWLFAIQTSGEDFKLNNSYRAFYARKLMYEVPQLIDVFEIRESPHSGIKKGDIPF